MFERLTGLWRRKAADVSPDRPAPAPVPRLDSDTEAIGDSSTEWCRRRRERSTLYPSVPPETIARLAMRYPTLTPMRLKMRDAREQSFNAGGRARSGQEQQKAHGDQRRGPDEVEIDPSAAEEPEADKIIDEEGDDAGHGQHGEGMDGDRERGDPKRA